ncbi:hypothetical protein DIPPA_61469 [Diplonema papillatum]|nr:hypothetical protein DIPPA_61469 [Diplonema papillatum]
MGNSHANPLTFSNTGTGIWEREENPYVVCIVAGGFFALYLLYVVIAIIKMSDSENQLDNPNEYLYLIVAPCVLPVLAIVLLVFMTKKRHVTFDDSKQLVIARSASMICLRMQEKSTSYASFAGCEYERVREMCDCTSRRRTYDLRITTTGPTGGDSITLATVSAYNDTEAHNLSTQLSHFVMCRTSGGSLCDPLACTTGPQPVPFANYLHKSEASIPNTSMHATPPPLSILPHQA